MSIVEKTVKVYEYNGKTYSDILDAKVAEIKDKLRETLSVEMTASGIDQFFDAINDIVIQEKDDLLVKLIEYTVALESGSE